MMRGFIKAAALLMAAMMIALAVGCTVAGSDTQPEKTNTAPAKTTEPSSEPTASPAQTKAEEVKDTLELTDNMKDTLEQLCYSMPDFESVDDIDDDFMRDFLFMFYTGGFGGDFYSEDTQQMLVEEQFAKNKIKELLGIDYDLNALEYSKENESCYSKEGILHVSVSDYGDIGFTFRDITDNDGLYTVNYDVIFGGDSESSGTQTFVIKKADNENGFIICAAKREMN